MVNEYKKLNDLKLVKNMEGDRGMDKSYIFELSYGNRVQEKQFIKDVLDNFDKNSLVGVNIFVNNNPYSLEFVLHLNFERDSENFDAWLESNYKDKKRNIIISLVICFFSMSKKGYNSFGLIDSTMVDDLITKEANDIFYFHDEPTISAKIKGGLIENTARVFLSHSSKDKRIVDEVFEELQKLGVRVWYDKYEIDPGDSITDKVNEGLSSSGLGILFLSKNFFDPSSGWPKSEMNYFIQKRMKTGLKNFICINLDISHEELPALLQDYRYINFSDEDAIIQLVHIIKKNTNI